MHLAVGPSWRGLHSSQLLHASMRQLVVEIMSLIFVQNLTTFCRNCASIFENVELMLKTKQLCLRRSVPIEPKTGNIWPKFCHPTNDLFYVARLGVSATLQPTTSFTWLVLEYLPRSRSLLYRRQILQENIRWKALDEIYKIYMLLHRSDLNISENFRQTFSHFLARFCKIHFFFSFFW